MRAGRGAVGAAVALAMLASCGPRTHHGTIGEMMTGEELSHGWPMMPGLVRVCSESVLSADGSEIVWDGFVSEEPAAVVAEWYREQLGTRALEQTEGDWTWRAPDPEAPTRVLSVYAVGGSGIFCDDLPSRAESFVNASEMFGRD